MSKLQSEITNEWGGWIEGEYDAPEKKGPNICVSSIILIQRQDNLKKKGKTRNNHNYKELIKK